MNNDQEVRTLKAKLKENDSEINSKCEKPWGFQLESYYGGTGEIFPKIISSMKLLSP